jgi:long-chain acyl-CoA synthetase
MELFLDYRTLCEIPERNSELFPSRISHRFRSASGFTEKTFSDFYTDIKMLTAGFETNGLSKGRHISFFADNRYEWACTDNALMSLGAVSVPRGSDTSPKEQKSIYLHSDSTFLIMENTDCLNELLAEFSPDEIAAVERIFIMDCSGVPPAGPAAAKTVYYKKLFEDGMELLELRPDMYNGMLKSVEPEDLATIIYTSGTSGNPKGVMLTHRNFLQNLKSITPLLHIDINNAEKTVSILPSWHVYERCFEYCTSAGGMSLFYSSIKNFVADLANEKPTLVCSVPRVWESVYGRIMNKMENARPLKRAVFSLFSLIAKKSFIASNKLSGRFISLKERSRLEKACSLLLNSLLVAALSVFYPLTRLVFRPLRDLMGGNLRASFSGGGSLPLNIDIFFNSIGIKLVNAYGMTETSPGSITRRLDRNTHGTIGIPLSGTEVKILCNNGNPARTGEKGQIYVRGGQVMKGYYKNPEATDEILSADGWLNTGDIGIMTESGDILITGRAKSTIVLMGGENAEPEPIEEKLKESSLIDHAVVVGQDKKGLTALISVNEEKLKHMAEKWKISLDEMLHKGEETILNSRIVMEVQKEIRKLISRENGFKPSEKITGVVLLKKKFSIGDELTQTLKVKRKHVEKKYSHLLK